MPRLSGAQRFATDLAWRFTCRVALLLSCAVAWLLFRRDVHALGTLRVDRLLHHAGLLGFTNDGSNYAT